MTIALNTNELNTALTEIPDWSGDTHGIQRDFVFKDFPSAIAYMSSLVAIIEADNHHPEWTNVYNRLSVTLRTHDADNQVSAKDIHLAKILDKHFN